MKKIVVIYVLFVGFKAVSQTNTITMVKISPEEANTEVLQEPVLDEGTNDPTSTGSVAKNINGVIVYVKELENIKIEYVKD